MGKLLVTELRREDFYSMFAIFGGNGYIEDYPILECIEMLEWNNWSWNLEIMRDIIAKIIIDDVNMKKLNQI